MTVLAGKVLAWTVMLTEPTTDRLDHLVQGGLFYHNNGCISRRVI